MLGGVVARLAAAGVSSGDAEPQEEPIYLWPECVDAWNHWQHLQTQWRVGMAGASGLDYLGVGAYLDEAGVRRGRKRRELFECFQAAEAACLDAWQAIREERQQQSAAR